jgi:CARDB
MGKKTVIRNIIVCFTILFLLTSFQPFVNASEDKPDLIVDGIGRVKEPEINIYSIVVNIKNIGNKTATGTFCVHWENRRLLFFGRIVRSGNHTASISELNPGEVYQYNFGTESHYIPFLGFFIELNCTVNPEKTIEESNYDNNYLTHRWVRGIGFIN